VFKHIVTHEVAYESLSYATRAQLHEQLAQYLETISFKMPVLDTLAYHYEKSNNLLKKIEYLRKAGDAARATFANDAALDYYTRLWPLLTNIDEKMHLQLKWGTVLELMGQWEQAEAHYQAALELSQTCSEPIEKSISAAHCQFALGKLYRQRGDYSTALEWLERARVGLAALDNQKDLSETLIEIGYTH
jgi:adenylate cyclase